MLNRLIRKLAQPDNIRIQVMIVMQIFYIRSSFLLATKLWTGARGQQARLAWNKLSGLGKSESFLLLALNRYRRFSCFYLSYALIRELMPLNWLLGKVAGLPGPSHCYLPGRFMLIDYMGRYLHLTIISTHLLWRLLQRFAPRPIVVPLIWFLLHDEHQIDSIHRQASASIKLANRQLRTSFYFQSHGSSSQPPRVHKLPRHPLAPVMYSLARDPRLGTWFRCRSTRTAAHRQRMALMVARSTIVLIIIYLFTICANFVLTLCMVLAKSGHARFYPGCLEAGWSQQYPMVTLVFDVTENIVFWLDSALTFSMVPMATLINGDFLVQWRQLQGQLKAIRLGHQHPNDPMCAERLAVECRARVLDVFLQVEAADQLLSDFNTAGVGFSLMSYISIEYYVAISQQGHNYLAVTALILGYLMFSLYSVALLAVHRTLRESYVLICGLMAHDKSRYKLRYSRLLDFYTGRNKCAYTLFRGQYPYLARTYLSVLGWTMSCGAVINTIFKPHNN